MDVAIATISAAQLTYLVPQYGIYFYLIALLIILNYLFSQQYYILNTLGGAVTGNVAFSFKLVVAVTD